MRPPPNNAENSDYQFQRAYPRIRTLSCTDPAERPNRAGPWRGESQPYGDVVEAAPRVLIELQLAEARCQEDRTARVAVVSMPIAARQLGAQVLEWRKCAGLFSVLPSRMLSNDPRAGIVSRHHAIDSLNQMAARQAIACEGPQAHGASWRGDPSAAERRGQSRRPKGLARDYAEATMICTHVAKNLRPPTQDPLDLLRDGLSGAGGEVTSGVSLDPGAQVHAGQR